MPAAPPLDPGVVAGGEPGAQGAGAAQQPVELHLGVAGDAGIGRAPGQVVVHEAVDDARGRTAPPRWRRRTGCPGGGPPRGRPRGRRGRSRSVPAPGRTRRGRASRRPATSCPCATRSAAAADESTPPGHGDEHPSTRRLRPLAAWRRDLEDELGAGEVAPDPLRLGPRRALHRDGAAVGLDDAPRHGQAQPAARGARRRSSLPGAWKKGSKTCFCSDAGDARSLIGDGEAQPAARRAAPRRSTSPPCGENLTALPTTLASACRSLLGIGGHRPAAGLLHGDVEPRLADGGAQVGHHLVGERVGVDVGREERRVGRPGAARSRRGSRRSG